MATWRGRPRAAARGAGRAIVALLAVGVLVVTGYAWAVYRDLSGEVVTGDVIDGEAPAPTADQPLTALLVGLDSRTDAAGRPLPPELLEQIRAGEDEGQLHTDTIILLHVPAGPAAQAVAISFPRDSYVPIAGGRGPHKINSAYLRGMRDAEDALAAQGIGGPELDRLSRDAGRRTLVSTVESLAGVGIDHYAEINLAGFVEITDALGGVPVCLNAPVRERRSGVDLPAGPQVVDGGDALAFVRQRHGLDGGDLDRITRQQAFLAGTARRALSAGTLTDPARVDRLLRAVTRHVVIDESWDLDRLAAQFGRTSGGDITFRTIPTGRPDLRTPADGIAVEVDPEQVRGFVRSVLAERRTTGPAPEDTASTATPDRPAPGATGAGAAGVAPPPEPTRDADPPITAGGVPCVD
jgi:LCP family protein required for cell wall assembly